MISFQDVKSALLAMPFGFENISEDSRLIEDLGADEEDINTIFFYLQMATGAELPSDEVFYRFAAHMPIRDLVEALNSDLVDPTYD